MYRIKKNIPLYALTGYLLTLAACKGIYEPNVVNMPLHEEKREYTVSVTHKNIQGSYALTNHLAVMGNGFFTTMPLSSDLGYKNTGEGVYGFLVEGAAGYYKYYPDLDLTLETYSGI